MDNDNRAALVVPDIDMPGQNGFDVLSAIKSDPVLASLPLVMLSASRDWVDVERSYGLRASA